MIAPTPTSILFPYTTLFRSIKDYFISEHLSRVRTQQSENLCLAESSHHPPAPTAAGKIDRKSTRLNSSHITISYAVFCLKKKIKFLTAEERRTHTHVTLGAV